MLSARISLGVLSPLKSISNYVAIMEKQLCILLCLGRGVPFMSGLVLYCPETIIWRLVVIYQKPFIIAEAGCNHKGDMEIAHELINTAAIYCKADAIKFQKRCPKELLTPEQYNAPHPHPENSYGKTYGEHREFLEFSVDQHAQLKEWCEQVGIIYSTSVWDMTSAKEIASLKPKFIKIPSACNTHYEMLQWLCDNYKGEIQLSFGMTTHAEEEAIVKLFEENGRAKDLAGSARAMSRVLKLLDSPDTTWELLLMSLPIHWVLISLSGIIRLTEPGKEPIMQPLLNLLASRVLSET